MKIEKSKPIKKMMSLPAIVATIGLILSSIFSHKLISRRFAEKYEKYHTVKSILIFVLSIAIGLITWITFFKLCAMTCPPQKPHIPTELPTIKAISPPPSQSDGPVYQRYNDLLRQYSVPPSSARSVTSHQSSLLSQM